MCVYARGALLTQHCFSFLLLPPLLRVRVRPRCAPHAALLFFPLASTLVACACTPAVRSSRSTAFLSACFHPCCVCLCARGALLTQHSCSFRLLPPLLRVRVRPRCAPHAALLFFPLASTLVACACAPAVRSPRSTAVLSACVHPCCVCVCARGVPVTQHRCSFHLRPPSLRVLAIRGGTVLSALPLLVKLLQRQVTDTQLQAKAL